MKKVTISKAEMIEMLMAKKGATILTVKAIVDPSKKMYASSPYKNKVFKVGAYNGLVNFDYEGNIEKQLEREGKTLEEFKKGESWHRPLLRDDNTLTPFCVHKTNNDMYLRLRVIKSKTLFTDYNGKFVVVDKDNFYPTEPYKNQGLKKVIACITMSLDNIKEIRIDKQNFRIV